MDLTGLSHEELSEIITTQKKYIAELESKMAMQELVPKKRELPERPSIPGKVYVLERFRKFRFPSFRFEGKEYRADEAQYDLPLMERIVNSTGGSILKEMK